MRTTVSSRPGALARPSSAWIGWGQWIALITMTLDHVTRYLLPEAWHADWVGSSLGRIAFPLFAGMVAWHALFNTRDPMRYARRILIIGLIAQLPYLTMPRDGFQWNICFTLALGLYWGSWLRKLTRRDATTTWRTALPVLVGSLLVWLWLGPWMEYGHRGLLLVPAYMLAIHALHRASETPLERLSSLAASLPLLLTAGLMNHSSMAKSFTVATATVVLLMAIGASQRIPAIGYRMPRRLWLAWYPAHFAAIAMLLYLIPDLAR
ncbi:MULTISPECIES: TraX family protein [unclassified Modicisalibacter]|uniref:TraX family protein n=1 Tax=unclassified Modicisalibacter TaxID=2679913 RepID=UPI001CCCBCCC|nr:MULTISPECIES: TraX family protein [unclassified Modicisalibacter]MBZ9559766.1 TraX [Modicisalibacter sp. R2A 31.J]MBZ9577218.1 TraX [Modicisalibacter sp. MOD 31.J]